MAGIPQVITEDRASGALVIDGSLKFDSSKLQYLTRTPTTAGNRGKWTWSCWCKRGEKIGNASGAALFAAYSSDADRDVIRYGGTAVDSLDAQLRDGTNRGIYTTSKFRDTGWYHNVVTYDSAVGVKIYVNGVEQPKSNASGGNATLQSQINNTVDQYIGARKSGGNIEAGWDGHMSQVYFLDGKAAGPEEFGFTDPLTNTWRPKKYDQLSPNNGSTWSSYLTSSTSNFYTGAQGVEKAFDGDTSTYVQQLGGVNPNYITFTPSGGIAHTSKVEIFINNAQNEVSYNGGSLQSISSGWNTIATGSGTLTSIRVERPSTNGAAFGAIRIDDVILIDGDTSNMGTNGFYLPMDGNSPIGKDQSGRGNDWTPVKFGGSVELPKATGALPILKTNEAGTVAKPGVRTDKKTYIVTEYGGKYSIDGVQQPTLSVLRGGTYTFDYTNASGHPFYLSSLPDGKHNSKAYSVEFDGSDQYLTHPNDDTITDWSSGDYTIELWAYFNSFNVGANSNTHLIGAAAIDSGAESWSLGPKSTGQMVWYYWNGSQQRVTGGTITTGRWYHLAMTHSGGVIRIFIDGNLSTTASVNGTPQASTLPLRIGKITNSSSLDGYVSNVRIVRGSAVYTSNFTPSQTTLTNITNTTFLACQDSDATTAPVAPDTITATGAAATQTHQPFLYNNVHGNFGVNTATSNTTKITIPHLAADTLYYYCGQHSNMGSSISVTTDIHKADPYAWKNVLSLPLFGNIDDVSDQINVGSTAKVATGNGDPVASYNGTNFYRGSYHFDGTGDYLTIPGNSDFDLKSAFTIEGFFFRVGGTANQSLLSTQNYYTANNNGNWVLRISNANQIAFASYNGQSDTEYVEFPAPNSSNRWHHFALVREGTASQTKFYLDGVHVGSMTVTKELGDGSSSGIKICTGNVNAALNGYMQDVRIYNGVAKYTSDFIPASPNPDILPDTPSGIVGKTNLAKITDGAAAFDGSGDYLGIPDSSDLDLGSGDFTLEAYIYQANAASNANDSHVILSKWQNSTNQKSYALRITDSSGQKLQVLLSTDGSANNIITSSDLISVQRWHHVAVVNDGGTVTLYIDGKPQSNTGTAGTLYDSSAGLTIGRTDADSGSQYFDGFISNLRVIKGTALYTSSFTPPTEPLTAVTNTKLLCCQSIIEPGAAAVAPNVSGSINTGTQWSNYLVSPNYAFMTNNPPTRAFNGLNTYGQTPPNSSTPNGRSQGGGSPSVMIFTPPGGIAYSSEVSIDYECHGPISIELNGTEVISLSGPAKTASGFSALTSGSGTITEIKLISSGSSGDYVSLYAIKVDGTVLKDPLAPSGDAAATNFSPFTDDINTIRGQASGYATLNPLDNTGITKLTNGNLDFRRSVNDGRINSTIAASSGKWYAECQSGNDSLIGISEVSSPTTTYPGGNAGSYGYFQGGQFYDAGSGAAYAATFATDDYIGVILDLDNSTLEFTKNGISQGVAKTGLPAGSYRFSSRGGRHDGTETLDRWNFGQKPFKFPPPDGFQPLSLSNAQPEKVIARPDQYVDVITYSGNSTSSNTITDLNFNSKPDFVWIKSRSGSSSPGSQNHYLMDSVRGANGASGTSKLYSNNNGAANSGQTATTNGVRFVHNGFELTTNNDGTNANNNYVAWCWKAGGNKNTFNIDDVGYANASDVNMNAGALNSTTYNQSEVWSNNTTASTSFDSGTLPQAFDGDLTTGPLMTGQTTTYVVDLSSDFTDGTVQVYTAGYQKIDVTDDGGTNREIFDGSGSGYGWYPATPATFTNIQSVTVKPQGSGSGNSNELRAIKVNGKILVDSNQTPPNAPSVSNIGASVGTRQGFSIIKYSGSGSNGSIAHGLSQAPDFFFGRDLEDTSNSRDWIIYHKSIGATGRLKFTTAATSTSSAFFQDTSPTNSLITVGTSNDINSTNDYVLYCWHDVPGLQKFGTYNGNGSGARGPFVELGFRPAIIWIKDISAAGTYPDYKGWVIYDSRRPGYNVGNGSVLYANRTDEEGKRGNGDADGYDENFVITSNGFAVQYGGSSWNVETNESGRTYIYCAWAEAPTVNLYGGHANAR